MQIHQALGRSLLIIRPHTHRHTPISASILTHLLAHLPLGPCLFGDERLPEHLRRQLSDLVRLKGRMVLSGYSMLS
jgi:hypothetical protein